MDAKELDSFVNKFKQLWRSGLSAHLDIDTYAGQAWVGLRVRLGQAQAVDSSSRRTRDGPARQRRRARRAAAAKEKEVEEASTDAVNAGEIILDNSEKEGEAGKASNSENAVDDPTEEVVEIVGESTAVEAATDNVEFTCEICDKTFDSVRGLRTHEGRLHKATCSTIPQLDGEPEMLDDFITYTFVSEFAREDIDYTLEEIFPAEMEAKLTSRVKAPHYGPRSADHLCSVKIKLPNDQRFSWPEMLADQAEVFKNLAVQKDFSYLPA